MKIERVPGIPNTLLLEQQLVEGSVYKEVDAVDDDVFLVTDEGSLVYLYSGSQYGLEDHFDSGARFVTINAKLVIE